jgi:hypothetical protein
VETRQARPCRCGQGPTRSFWVDSNGSGSGSASVYCGGKYGVVKEKFQSLRVTSTVKRVSQQVNRLCVQRVVPSVALSYLPSFNHGSKGFFLFFSENHVVPSPLHLFSPSLRSTPCGILLITFLTLLPPTTSYCICLHFHLHSVPTSV